jgi:protein-disulfide isomerase
MHTEKRFRYLLVGGLIGLAAFIYGLNRLADQDPDIQARQDAGRTDTTADTKVKGDPEASVTLIEYSDFQCPACAAYYPLTKRLSEEFPDTLKVVYRHYPLTRIHPNAFPAARAAEAAHWQGKFWEMHDLLFEKQKEWSGLSDPTDTFTAYAQGIGLDTERFREDLKDSGLGTAVKADQAKGDRDKVQGTPTFLLNGQKLDNPSSYEEFRKAVEEAVAKNPRSEDRDSGQAFHRHADFAVYVNGRRLDFSQAKYQSGKDAQDKGHEHDEFVHLHDGNGKVVHFHKAGITFGYFFKTLGIELSKDCLKLDTGEKHCADASKDALLNFYVNGRPVESLDGYVPNDLDRILVSYGQKSALTDSAVGEQIASVSDEACIYSEKCPERGAAPEEECVGGLGSACDDGQKE